MPGKAEYPYKWVDLTEEEKEERRKLFSGCPRSSEVEAIRSVPDNIIMPKPYEEMAEKLYNFELRPDDIWVITYPKCGTTWTQETMWQISHGFDPEASKNGKSLFTRSPFIEFTGLVIDFSALAPKPDPSKPAPPPPDPDQIATMMDSLNYADKLPSPRVIKSHMPFEFLPPNLLDVCKVVYVCRNVKDTCVSFFHHIKLGMPMYGFTGEFEELAELFKKGELCYGSYWYHLKSAMKRIDNPNMKFVWYEEMKRDHLKVLRELCDFTGYKLSEDKLLELKEHLTIDSMRKIATDNLPEHATKVEKDFGSKFFRKGTVGDWKNYFQGEKAEEWDKWIQENIEGTDIKMDFVL